MNTKVCRKCGIEKSVDEFYKCDVKRNRDGFRSYCIECGKNDNKKREPKYKEMRRQYRAEHKDEMKAHKREYYEKNKDSILAQNKDWRNTPKGRYTTYRNGAKFRNMEFNLTEDEFNIYWQVPCHYCGSDIDTIGIDRVDSTIGYNMSNIVPCCTICNMMKMDLDSKVFLTQIEKIYQHKKDCL
jgi:hypothetical protein